MSTAEWWMGIGCSIDPSAVIGRGTVLGDYVKIGPLVIIGEGCVIEDFAIIGYATLTNTRHDIAAQTVIGNYVIIRPRCTVYRGCQIGDGSRLNHSVELRELTIIGHHSSIGSKVWCEGYTTIGNHVTVHAQCHLTACMVIDDYVFIGPMVTTANARAITYKRTAILADTVERGPIIRFGARIASQAMLLPGVVVGREALIASASVVTKDIPAFQIAMGSPAKLTGIMVPEKERLVAGIDFPVDHPILTEEE